MIASDKKVRERQRSKRTYIIANWKSYLSNQKDIEKIQSVYWSLEMGKHLVCVVCPSPVHMLLDFPEPLAIGAQDVRSTSDGTGMWNPKMLSDLDVKYCIIGHSELRNYGEDDVDIKKKMMALLDVGIVPIICVGEYIRDEQQKYINIVRYQVRKICENVPLAQAGRMIIAYEPVWAIGPQATRACSAYECYEMAQLIREESARCISGIRPEHVVVVYGGSVDSNNAQEFLERGSVDGLLIGRASVDKNQITSIINIANAINI